MPRLRCKPEFFVIENCQGLLLGLNGSNPSNKLVRCSQGLNQKNHFINVASLGDLSFSCTVIYLFMESL
jgi:hypothetical protein